MTSQYLEVSEKDAYNQALIRTLSAAKVELVRYLALDVCSTTRCKAVPLKQIQRKGTFENQVCIAKICFGGLPPYADSPAPGCGLDARETQTIMPDMSTLRILPYATKSALLLGNVYDSRSGASSELCCRSLLQRVLQSAKYSFNVALSVGVELEFSLFDAKNNSPVDAETFAGTSLLNRHEAFISCLYRQLEQQDISVEQIHSESAPGQLELVLVYSQDPVQMADNVTLARDTIRAVARGNGLKAIFLPKVFPMAAGNGLHLHLSIRDTRTGANLFVKEGVTWAETASDIDTKGQAFTEGIIQHLPALLALTLPTSNSFARVGPGLWTGSEVGWAFEDKEIPIRACRNNGVCDNIEYKLMDATANIYLALAAITSAGMSGIAAGLSLRSSIHEKHPTIALPVPASIEDALDCLEKDDLLIHSIPAVMMQGYLAIRRAEANRSSKMSLEDHVQEALERA